MGLLYGADHPFGRRTKGSTTALGQIDRTALRQFHRTRYHPKGLSVVVVGDVDPSRGGGRCVRFVWRVGGRAGAKASACIAASGDRAVAYRRSYDDQVAS